MGDSVELPHADSDFIPNGAEQLQLERNDDAEVIPVKMSGDTAVLFRITFQAI